MSQIKVSPAPPEPDPNSGTNAEMQPLQDLDQKIQKQKSRILYRTLSFGQKDVDNLKGDRVSLIRELSSTTSSKETLGKVSVVVQEEITRLEEKSASDPKRKDSYDAQIAEYEGLHEVGDAHLREISSVETLCIDEVTSPDLYGRNKFRGQKLTECCRSSPNLQLSMRVDGEDVTVSGAGVDSNGRIKAAGTYGRVCFGVYQGKLVAMKIVTIEPHLKEEVENEINFLLKMEGSEHVMGASKIIYLTPEEGKEPTHVCIMMDKVEGGDVLELMRAKSLDIKAKVSILRDMAVGLQEMHEHGAVYRDLKPANTLYDERTKRARLTDLGGCIYASKSRPEEGYGTPAYCSPESKKLKKLTTASDIYSFGVVAHEMLTGKTFKKSMEFKLSMEDERDGVVALASYKKSGLPESQMEHARNLVNACLRYQPGDRINAEELVANLTYMLNQMGE